MESFPLKSFRWEGGVPTARAYKPKQRLRGLNRTRVKPAKWIRFTILSESVLPRRKWLGCQGNRPRLSPGLEIRVSPGANKYKMADKLSGVKRQSWKFRL